MINPFEAIESRLSSIENLILDIKHEPKQAETAELPETPIPIQEAAQFLNLTVPTMYSKVSKAEVPVSKRGKRLYFFRSELLKYLKEGRKKSNAEIEAEAEAYLSDNKKGLK